MKTSTKTLITISVVLNVLAVGFYLGTFTNDYKKRIRHHKNFNPEIMAKLKSVKEDSKAFRLDMEKTNQEILSALVAEDFDPIAFETASAKLHQCRGEMMCSMTDKIKAIASEMSLEERQELAKILKHHFNRKPRYGKKHHK